MNQQAEYLAKLQGQTVSLSKEITQIEEDLASSGSAKTADDVQAELTQLADEMYVQVFLIYTTV